MARWEGPINFEKYYGERKYKEIQTQLEKINYSQKEKMQNITYLMQYSIFSFLIQGSIIIKKSKILQIMI